MIDLDHSTNSPAASAAWCRRPARQRPRARDELQQNFKAVLQAGLAKLDLVTREEFDVQRAVLLRTREKLEALERSRRWPRARHTAADAAGIGQRAFQPPVHAALRPPP